MAEARRHWAFQPVAHPAPPPVRNARWERNPIDAFILAELEARQIEPSPRADKTTLLRRVYLDLAGMPPSPAQFDAFLADSSPDAFDRVVDELLASPRYGEHWARHWLDLARYAESEGFKADETRPNAWRYRDYVIRAFNDDKPYDRFIREQIAGDELWPDDPEARVATAFNRHYPDESNARNLRQRRQEILNDITDTVGAVFTGLTYGCARCHDHKYDPILQSDYYRLQAFFANTAAEDDEVLASPDAVRSYSNRLAQWENLTRDVRAQMEAIESPKRHAMEKDYFDKYPPEIQAAWRKPESERTPFERQMVWKARQYLDPKSHEYVGNPEAIASSLKGENKKRWNQLKSELEAFGPSRPASLPTGSGMVDLNASAPSTYVLARGIYDQPLAEVQPGLMQILYPQPARIVPPTDGKSTGRRTALANLLASPDNPLTARVMVNRVWQSHFGRGLVGTPSDFGLNGERPSNPPLLDWLATEFVARGWSLKALHRLIVTSSTYQQSSLPRAEAAPIDPENQTLWRYPLQRLEGEVIRDSALAVAGLLNLKMGGPSVFPELPTGMPIPRGGWKTNERASERNRRSIYVFVRRNTRYPLFECFDMPDPHESCARRNVTISPIQALHLLNSDLTLSWAQGLAGRVVGIAGKDLDSRIDTAYRIAYGRLPDKAERHSVRDFFAAQTQILAERVYDRSPLALPGGGGSVLAPAEGAALVDFCHMLINANEFIYRN